MERFLLIGFCQYPPNATPGCCLNILPARASTAGGAFTIGQNDNAVQPLGRPRSVKTMAYVNAYRTPYKIVGCFNFALTGATATMPPCGISFTEDSDRTRLLGLRLQF